MSREQDALLTILAICEARNLLTGDGDRDINTILGIASTTLNGPSHD